VQPSLKPVPAPPAAHPPDLDCPNCGARANGKFCAHCGAETEVEVPSAGEFLHEFVGHYVAIEGKLPKTLQRLMFRPGQLTVDYLHGRRMAYISPLRLYLTLSLVVFALIRLVGVELPHLTIEGDSVGATYQHSVAKRTATLYINISDGEEARTSGETIGGALQALGKVNDKWGHNLQQFMSEPAAEKSAILNHGFLAYLPYMLVGALPLFALYLKLIYRGTGRRYGEHLVFALHANAFAFLLASLMIVLPGNVVWLAACLHAGAFQLISAWDCLQLIPFLWLILYLPAAMRRVYAGGRLATAGRWLLLIASHVLVISAMTIAAELIGIVMHH